MSNLDKIDKRVARGVRYLEKHYGPDWRGQVTSPLNQRGSDTCVLAQVSGLNFWTVVRGHRNRWGVKRGFNAPHREWVNYDSQYFAHLTTAWDVEVGTRGFQPLKGEV